MAKTAKPRPVDVCPSPCDGETGATDKAKDRQTDQPLADAYTQIREARDRIVAAVIQRAIDDGCYQRAKWLFEYGGLLPQGQQSPADDPSLLRLLLDQLQIPEGDDPVDNQGNQFSANDAAVK
jgi:hypothetical protein